MNTGTRERGREHIHPLGGAFVKTGIRERGSTFTADRSRTGNAVGADAACKIWPERHVLMVVVVAGRAGAGGCGAEGRCAEVDGAEAPRAPAKEPMTMMTTMAIDRRRSTPKAPKMMMVTTMTCRAVRPLQ